MFILWAVFNVWFFIGCTKTAWKWPDEKLGIKIFKFLQIIFLVFTIPAMIGTGFDLEVLFIIFIAFDTFIIFMMIYFLLISWCARCHISWKTYLEIGTIFVLFAFQVWMSTD
jgi:hypothetical protein